MCDKVSGELDITEKRKRDEFIFYFQKMVSYIKEERERERET